MPSASRNTQVCSTTNTRCRNCIAAYNCAALKSWNGSQRHSIIAGCAILSGRPADSHAIDAQGRLADAYRHALAFLAAHADTRIELHVVADHGDPVQDLRTVADQGSALDRIGDLAVFDHVGFAGREHEFA